MSRTHREIFDWISGARLALKRGTTGATGNIYAGLHEFADMAFTLHFLRRGDLFVDIGANIGSYTVLGARVCGAKTIAFEPDSDTANCLRRNIALNELEALVEVHEAALGSEPGSVTFSVGLDTVNRVVEKSWPNTQMVPLETLDRALAGRTPILIKMDVEGYEREVLRGAITTLSRPELKALLVEDRSPETNGLLAAAGFQEFGYDAFARRITAPSQSPTQNALWIREPDFVQARVACAPPVRILGEEI